MNNGEEMDWTQEQRKNRRTPTERQRDTERGNGGNIDEGIKRENRKEKEMGEKKDAEG